MTLEILGSGGLGPARERDRAAVVRDVTDGIVHAESGARQLRCRGGCRSRRIAPAHRDSGSALTSAMPSPMRSCSPRPLAPPALRRVASTPSDPSQRFLNAVERILADANLAPHAISYLLQRHHRRHQLDHRRHPPSQRSSPPGASATCWKSDTKRARRSTSSTSRSRDPFAAQALLRGLGATRCARRHAGAARRGHGHTRQ